MWPNLSKVHSFPLLCPYRVCRAKFCFPYFFIHYYSRGCCSQQSVVCLFDPFLWLILDTEKKPLAFFKLWETRVRGGDIHIWPWKQGWCLPCQAQNEQYWRRLRLDAFHSSLFCWHLPLPLHTFLSLLNHIWLHPLLKNVTFISGYPKQSKWM